jgi:uncharacterized protein (DUF1499 family)
MILSRKAREHAVMFVLTILSLFVCVYILVGPRFRPANLGVHAGKLSPCPSSPNCVCSQGADAAHAVEPVRYTGPAADAWDRLKRAVATLPRTTIASATDDYLHAEWVSPVVGYVDDLECLLDRDANVIHVRSASRVGYSDMGYNKARVEALRAAFVAVGGAP